MVDTRGQRAIKIGILASISVLPFFLLRPIDVTVEVFVFGFFGFIFLFIHEFVGVVALSQFVKFVASRSWYNAIPAKYWHPERDTSPIFFIKVLTSLGVLAIWFLASMLVLSIFFYSLGPPFSNPRVLLLASFLGTAVVRFSRYGSIEASVRSVELLTEFLLAFGVLIGIFMIVFGPVTVDGFTATVSAQLDAIVAILILLFLSDSFFQAAHDRNDVRQTRLNLQ